MTARKPLVVISGATQELPTADSITADNADVIGKVLTGYTSGSGTVAAADSILAAIQKLNGNDGLKAPLASPTFTGTPAAPTASAGTNTTQIATTAHVFAERANTVTYTNKRVTPRIGTITSSATPTPDIDGTDQLNVTALAVGATLGAPTGTPTDGQTYTVRFKDNGTARALAYNAIYRALGVTLPTTTVISKTLYLGMAYNAADVKYDILAVAQEA